MLFNSQGFVLGFLPITLAGFFVLGRLGGRVWALRWLVVASLFFYGWWAPRFTLLLVASIGANLAVGRHILRLRGVGRERAAGAWLVVGVTANLALLGWFKYAMFARHILAGAGLDLPTLEIFLPLAISFFTFQQILFLTDCRRGDTVPVPALPYACFVAFFPHLIAGPIVRPAEILPPFAAADVAVPREANLAAGLTLFLLGLTKKLVLADLHLPNVKTDVLSLSEDQVRAQIERAATTCIHSILAGEGFRYDVPVRTGANQLYVAVLDRIVLKDKVAAREFASIRNGRKTAITTRILGLVYELCLKKIHVTKRDLFYVRTRDIACDECVRSESSPHPRSMCTLFSLFLFRLSSFQTDVKLFTKQADSDEVIEDVAAMLGSTRTSLNGQLAANSPRPPSAACCIAPSP